MDYSKEEREAVIEAFENPNYLWRTVQGVADETGFSVEKVLEIIRCDMDTIIKSSIPSVRGESLYTTRKRYRESASFSQKLLSAIKNTIE